MTRDSEVDENLDGEVYASLFQGADGGAVCVVDHQRDGGYQVEYLEELSESVNPL